MLRSNSSALLIHSFWAFCFLFFAGASGIYGQEDLPAWILYEQAEQEYRNRNHGMALHLYGLALDKMPQFPEAQLGIARIHQNEADAVLAEHFYRLAIKNAEFLIIPDEEYTIRIELALLYQNVGKEEEYLDELHTIIAQDTVFWGELRTRIINSLYENGFNRTLVLYRLNFPQALEAHRQLGHFYVKNRSNTDLAVAHLLFAVMETTGQIVRAVIEKEYDYEFTTMKDLLSSADSYKQIAEYVKDTGFRDDIRALAKALENTERISGIAAAEQIMKEITQ